jgi:hypothetical protein
MLLFLVIVNTDNVIVLVIVITDNVIELVIVIIDNVIVLVIVIKLQFFCLQITYDSVGPVQMTFLRLLSEEAHQVRKKFFFHNH